MQIIVIVLLIKLLNCFADQIAYHDDITLQINLRNNSITIKYLQITLLKGSEKKEIKA